MLFTHESVDSFWKIHEYWLSGRILRNILLNIQDPVLLSLEILKIINFLLSLNDIDIFVLEIKIILRCVKSDPVNTLGVMLNL